MNIPEKPIGGTEIMYNELLKRIDNSLLDDICIFNYIKDADFNKKTIYWNQLSYDQDAVQFLNDEDIKSKINYFVFVSHWQAEQFRKRFNIPGFKSLVIQNAALDIQDKILEDNKEKIKICYTSTPWRGLQVLLEAWKLLQPENCELHIFSSTKIYGSDFHNTVDVEYQELYEKAKSLPGVVYRDFVTNEELRKELVDFDIMAYPCTFEETSCISVIEAISSGLKVVCSNLGALPETTEGWANLYTYKMDFNLHVSEFVNQLGYTIDQFKAGAYKKSLEDQIRIYKKRWSWETRINDWTNFINNVNMQPITEADNIRTETWDNTIFREVYNDNEYDVPSLFKEDVIIDIGAHIGSFAKRCLDNGAGQVICFEPSQENFEKLQENLKDYQNVTFSNLAVWSKSNLYISFATQRDLDKQNKSLATAFTTSADTRVNTISLDSILENFGKVRILKIDTEGSEYPIILNSTLLDRVEEIVGEIHEINSENQLFNPLSYKKECKKEEIFEYLSKFGFEVSVQNTEWPHTLIFKATKQSNPINI